MEILVGVLGSVLSGLGDEKHGTSVWDERMKKNNEIAAESLAVRIKRLRIANGFTQGQLGELIGISSTAVGKWEQGLNLPKGRYVAKRSGALGIDVAELLGDTPTSIDGLAEYSLKKS